MDSPGLTDGESATGISIRAIKEHLAKDAPVVIGMMVGGSFMQPMMGKELWTPTDEDRSQMGFGGHAMCVIGYDDRRVAKYANGESYTGAFQIMNSWGPEWGNTVWPGLAMPTSKNLYGKHTASILCPSVALQ